MGNVHYWIGEGNSFYCKCCKARLLLSTQFIGEQYSTSYVYTYENGDKSTVFSRDVKDICPVEEWDLGKWLPGAVQI